MAATELEVARAFDDLARLIDRTDGAHVRIRLADGSAIEGVIHDVDYVNVLFVEEPSGRYVEVPAHELQTLDTEVPRRGREWTFAVLGIAAATVALVGYAQLPWVPPRPTEADIAPGFLVLMAIVVGLGSLRSLRRWFTSRFTRWQRVYPGDA